MKSMPAQSVLDDYFLEARCRLLDVAAILDRIERGSEPDPALADPRMERIREAIAALAESGTGRAERIQEIFSLDYDPDWRRPRPRTA